jgi:hypothetical protein
MAEMIIANIEQTLLQRQLPTITLWNRLEGRPRTHDFHRALKAEVRDALWMLTRQWQVGEFQGDDAGSPIFAKIHMQMSRFDAYQASTHTPQPFDYDLPLEAQVEQRPIAFERGNQPISLDIRLLMGRQWLKLLAAIGDFKSEFCTLYPVDTPDPTQKDDAEICSHTTTWQMVAVVAQRAMDGYQLYQFLTAAPANHAHNGTSIPAANHAAVETLEAKFIAWFERLLTQPATSKPNAWMPDHLEYQFAVAAPDSSGSGVLKAEEYYHGRLDWYNLDIDPTRSNLELEPVPAPPGTLPAPTQSFIPTEMRFEGMPHTRWWTFEDSRTSFGNINAGTKDLAQLMLMEFGLIYANDWFLFPLTLPVGTSTRIRGLAVTNVFGERTWIEAAGRGLDEDWQRWSMYTHAVYGDDNLKADMRAVLLPTVPKIQESSPLEEVLLIRDEMANMVWGIESRIAMVEGRSIPGYEAGVDLKHFYERLVSLAPAPPPPDAAASVRYQVMSNYVPENWIPFIPVHVPGSNREIRLQRAALPRVIPRDPHRPEKIRPRSTLLREGMAAGAPYFLNEEEITRAGTDVRQTFQRTRWHDGRCVIWLGVRKSTGRGEGSSNLRFDYLAPVPSTPPEA